MCGIAGVLISQGQQAAQQALSGMSAALTHRGPDDSGSGVFCCGQRCLALGHTRLSIIDLSCAGHQPMTHAETGSQIIFNGEIYNFPVLRRELEALGHRFIGHSDTEVLLHALVQWGPACLSRLQGMYAFGFYNASNRTLLLARDPLGIKPLYLSRLNDGLLFSSEVRSIAASGLIDRRLDLAGATTLLAFGAVQQPLTVLQGVRSFPPGHYQIFKLDKEDQSSAPVAFWNFPTTASPMEHDQAVIQVRSLLESAVRDHLVSDVPVGMALSSGLDSTIVAGLAAKYTAQLRSFTIGFDDQPDLSELPMARRTAELFGLNHTEIIINGSDAEAAAQQWLQHLDQPSVDGLNVYIISKVMRSHGITVALSGQGGDELFGGYPSFADVPRLRRMMQLLVWLPRSLRMPLSRLIMAGRPAAVQQKFADVLHTRGTVLELYLQRRRVMSNQQLALLGVHAHYHGLTADLVPPEAIAQLPTDCSDGIWCTSLLESRFYQGNMLLRDADANGMAHSLEIRVPMLDQRVADYMLRVPGRVRLPSGKADKHLLRAAFPDLLRSELLNQSKIGFRLPIHRWMAGPMRGMCEAALAKLKATGAFRAEGIEAIWKEFLSAPETPIWSRAFTLCVLGSYISHAGISR